MQMVTDGLMIIDHHMHTASMLTPPTWRFGGGGSKWVISPSVILRCVYTLIIVALNRSSISRRRPVACYSKYSLYRVKSDKGKE